MKLFVKRDLDGFFGLFVDNLVQLLLIISLCSGLCGMPGELLYGVIVPGAALSILLGNLFYAWQAHRLAKKTGRTNVTALPYGINTPSLLVYIFFVIQPTYQQTGDPFAAWKMGLIACLGSGVIEFFGAFVAGALRRHTPRAALLSTLAGIAIGFISMTFALQIYQKPIIAMLPLGIVLVGLFSQIRLPVGVPSGFLAILLGTGLAWLMTLVPQGLGLPAWLTYGAAEPEAVRAALGHYGWRLPVWCGPEILSSLQSSESWLPHLAVIIPMGLFNVLGSLQNIESAEAAGDSYATAPSMVVNGLGTILAACLGSCFPTTIYIGHPGWKALGARAGYSTLNGLVIVLLALSGLVSLVAAIVPIEAGAGIVLWIGIIITAQAFQTTPSEHAPAVAIGLFPAIAAWGATVLMGAFLVANGTTLQEVLTVQSAAAAPSETEEAAAAEPGPAQQRVPAHPEVESNGFLVHGLLLMERGYIFTCMILAAASACLIDRKFFSAATWLLSAAVLTAVGVMHAYQVFAGNALDSVFRLVAAKPDAVVYRADDIAIGYLLCGLLFLGIGFWTRKHGIAEGH